MRSNEMFNKKSKNINIKIGQIIPNENITPKGLDKDFLVNLYKKHLYALKKGKKSYFQTQNAIAHPVSRTELLNELKKSQLLGQTNDGKMIYLYDYSFEYTLSLRCATSGTRVRATIIILHSLSTKMHK